MNAQTQTQTKIQTQIQTITHIARPVDKRRAWWQMVLPENLSIDMLSGAQKLPAAYLRSGSDLELLPGTILIDSEAKSHRRNRGYDVCIGRADQREGRVVWKKPGMEQKMFIKADGRQDLMVGAGDVAAVIRCAMYIRSCEDQDAAWDRLFA
jgi:hypothetical protein